VVAAAPSTPGVRSIPCLDFRRSKIHHDLSHSSATIMNRRTDERTVLVLLVYYSCGGGAVGYTVASTNRLQITRLTGPWLQTGVKKVSVAQKKRALAFVDGCCSRYTADSSSSQTYHGILYGCHMAWLFVRDVKIVKRHKNDPSCRLNFAQKCRCNPWLYGDAKINKRNGLLMMMKMPLTFHVVQKSVSRRW
jgi:hypothetical protein